MKRIFGLLACSWLLLSVALPAEAQNLLHLTYYAQTAYITPGTLAPYPSGGAWAPCNGGSCPGAQGNPSDYGYTKPTKAVWDQVPDLIVTGTVNLCIIASHAITSTTAASGNILGIDHVTFFVNGGSGFTTAALTTSTPSGEPGYCAKLNTASLGYDGRFQARAWVYPVTGLLAIMETQDLTTARCFSYCALNLNGNHGGALPTSLVHVDTTFGVDQVGCGTSTGSSACLTPCYAAGQIATNTGGDVSNTFMAVAPTRLTANVNCGTRHPAATGFLTVEPDASAGGNVTNVIWANNANPNGLNVGAVNIATGIDLSGIASSNGINSGWTDANGLHDAVGMISGAVFNGPGANISPDQGPFQLNRWGPTYASAETIQNIKFGCEYSKLYQNVSFNTIGSDLYHGCQYGFNSVVNNITSAYAGVGNTTLGSNVITGLTSQASMRPGYGIQISTGGVCFPSGTTIVSLISSTSIQISTNATATCNSQTFNNGAHPDLMQFDGNFITGPVMFFGLHVGGIVDAQGIPYVQGGVTVNNAAFYDVQSAITNNGRTNFQPIGTSDDFLFINDTWSGGAFNRESATNTNFEFVNASCATPPGKIGTNGGNFTYYNDPVINKCH